MGSGADGGQHALEGVGPQDSSTAATGDDGVPAPDTTTTVSPWLLWQQVRQLQVILLPRLVQWPVLHLPRLVWWLPLLRQEPTINVKQR
jgi:hypothetical protein